MQLFKKSVYLCLSLFLAVHLKAFSQSVVINEIMVDPEPVVGLPPYEYIELFNRSNDTVNLENWSLKVGKYQRVIPACNILPHGYIVLTSTQAVDYLSKYGSVVGITSFPALTNTGNTIIISNANGNIISVVSYTDEWYKDDKKSNGGWSLEQIDPDNICGGIDNWTASISELGGTPCSQNSVFKTNKDTIPPFIERAIILDSSKIQIFFNEPVDTNTININCFVIDNSLSSVSSFYVANVNHSSVILLLSTPLISNKIYNIELNCDITDCAGNKILKSIVSFAYPEKILPKDIIINEILSNPNSDGEKYVEIYNKSNKILDLSDLLISSFDSVVNSITSQQYVYNSSFLIFPKEYYVLTENPEKVKSQYKILNNKAFIKMSAMPTMDISSGIIMLLDKSFNVIDKLIYSDDMHYPLLTSTKGVSLERINPYRETQDKNNWHSASETSGYGTPGYINSQYSDNILAIPERIKLVPEIFSPDNDGYNDFLNIYYSFEHAGYTLNVKIYDSNSQLVRTLLNNTLMSQNGVFIWDGLDDNKNKAPIGIYIIIFEAFDIKGNVEKFRKVCVLAGKL
jgi:hypothetical protein